MPDAPDGFLWPNVPSPDRQARTSLPSPPRFFRPQRRTEGLLRPGYRRVRLVSGQLTVAGPPSREPQTAGSKMECKDPRTKGDQAS